MRDYRRTICCVVISLLIFSLQGFASPPFQQWQRYTVDGEEFSANLPSLPAMRTEKTYLMRLTKTRIERELGSYWDGLVYTIRTSEKIGQLSLDDFITKRQKSVTNVTPISNGKFAGKQLEFTVRGFSGSAQYFETKNHLYEFAVMGATGDDPRVKEYFASIVLGGKRQGTEVKDGMGAVFSLESSGESEQIFTSKEVDRKVLVVTRPEPSYTESARQGKIIGTVVLKVVFGANGGVRDILVVKGLPLGLTDQSIAAAKQMRFIPAMKNGQFVSSALQLEYNFNLY